MQELTEQFGDKPTSAVTDTEPEPETVVFWQNRGEQKPQYFWK